MNHEILKQLQPLDLKEKAFIAEIGPSLAMELLTINFPDNRPPSKQHIMELASAMKDGRWRLGNDALTIDEHGRFVNGCHRLNAVVQSGTTQKFVILCGVTKDTAQILDIGKKRSMSQRITISGTRISNKECAIIRHAMNDYVKTIVGTIQFGYSRHDELVKNVYEKHKHFLQIIKAHNSTNSFLYAAALKMFAEMTHYSDKYSFRHDMTPLDRARLWIDLTTLGYSQDGVLTGLNETAANVLKHKKDNRKREKDGSYWADKECLQFTITAAFKFMLGEPSQHLIKFRKDPFTNFTEIPSTNPQ
jgi:hypothetical protein